MSEYVVANIVNYEREFYNVYLNNQKKNWILDGKISEHRSISDLKIGILGVGQIGNYSKHIFNIFLLFCK